MRKIVAAILLCGLALTASAVPARRGWQTRTQADGTTIEVQQMGDEYYHYMINREGQEVREEEGQYVVVGEAPTVAVASARRAKSAARRQRKEVGTEPYPAPRGLLILANFSDTQFKSTNSKAVMDSLINAKNCQVNEGYGSAAQYFKDQSYGQYQPVFDVVGPVTLSKSQSYYGTNDSQGNDKYATDAVIEACILANGDVNFADYDWNNDGYVDFVYVIYAGKGEADGGAKTTIWPHNYSIQEVIKWKGQGTYSVYSKSDTKLDGKYLDNYAMSQEIDGQTNGRAGNGTFCHEFGHVIGLPDFYDTDYGSNYNNQVTPNEWDIMDGGGYNGNGHCPPNYSAWEKYFMGWITPENLGTQGAKLTLYPNGTAQHNVYQINTSGKLQTATTEGLNYYIECRQQTGWDSNLPAAGMLIWKVNFSSSAWTSNEPNNTSGNPLYTLVIPSGTRIGADYGTQNVWPYSSTKSWSGVSGKPLKDITKSGNNITLVYIEEPAVDCELTGITLNTNNVQKRFLVDAAFSYTGLVVTAQYSNCANKTVTPTSVSTPDMSTVGDKTVTVSYTEEEVTKTNTYTIEVVEPKIYTIRFFDNGEQIGEDQKVQENQQAQKPANPTPACEDYTFVGWWTEALEADNTQEKSWITNFKATQNQDYYAVYSKTEVSESESGSADFDGKTAGTYKIYALVDGVKYYAVGAVSDNKIASTTNEAEAGEFVFEDADGDFAIKVGAKYLKYSGSKTNLSTQTVAYPWAITKGSVDGYGSWHVESTGTNRCLAFSSSSTSKKFGAYSVNNIGKTQQGSTYYDIEIVGEGGPKSTTYYSTVETCAPTAIEQAVAQPTAIKAIRNGQLVIIRGTEMYNVTGVRIQ